MIDVVVVALGIVLIFATHKGLSLYIAHRKFANSVLALATKEFFEATDALLKTPEDLPDEALAMLDLMNVMAVEKGSDRELLNLLRKRPSAVGNKQPEWLLDMRDELQPLFAKATTSWLHMMTTRNTLTGIRIVLQLMRRQVRDGNLAVDNGKAAIPAIAGLRAERPPNGHCVT